MSFVIRPVEQDDLSEVVDLAKQFNLLNLPGDKRVISNKIEKSLLSFAGELSKDEAEYLFVLEDLQSQRVIGSSLIIAKHGNEDIPHYFFRIHKKDRFSSDLGLGFIHQVLRFYEDTDGPTEIGGLLVDKSYRRRPEKLGKQMSLARFLYMALHQERFEERVLCELTPPLTEDGRSEFWESLGRRFTGLPYQEADLLSQSHKEFIRSLFPEEDIYLCLLDAKARTVVGRVGEETKPAQHLLESIGFKYLDEVDPFDGGPHYGAELNEIGPVAKAQRYKVKCVKDGKYPSLGLVARVTDPFRCALLPYECDRDELRLLESAREILKISEGDEVLWAPFHYQKISEVEHEKPASS